MSDIVPGLEPEEVDAIRGEYTEVTGVEVSQLTYHEYLKWWTRVRKLQRYFLKSLIPLNMFDLAFSPEDTTTSRVKKVRTN
jgi:hypothetical protein